MVEYNPHGPFRLRETMGDWLSLDTIDVGYHGQRFSLAVLRTELPDLARVAAEAAGLVVYDPAEHRSHIHVMSEAETVAELRELAATYGLLMTDQALLRECRAALAASYGNHCATIDRIDAALRATETRQP